MSNILNACVYNLHQSAEEHNNYWTVFITLATAVSLVLLTLIFFVKYPGAFNFFDQYQSKSLIHPSKIFVGREQEMSKLMDLLDFRSDADVRIVNIVGSPGFGKSTLAVHVGDQMVKQGVEVHYVNMNEYQGQDIDIQIELAEKILRAADYSLDRYTFKDLIKWLRKLFWNSLIIIDDCDDLVHNNRTTFFHALGKMVEQSPRIKVLITSREVTIHLEYVRRYRIYELSKRASCELFEQILPVGTNFTTTEIEEIAKLTGNAPLALQIVGALLSSPNPPSPSYIIEQLNSHPINLLSHEDLQHEHKLNVSISLSYRYLSPEMQMISQYLAKFSGSFTLEAANAIVICGQAYPCLDASRSDFPVTKTLRSLTSRSLIEFNLIKKQRYTFHRLIMEFLREMQVSDSNKAEFNSNFQSYYSSLLTQTINIFEADYKLALHNLGIERHNYQKILDDLKAKNHDVQPFLEIVASIAGALMSPVRILNFFFSDEEIMNSALSSLEYIEENQLLQQKLDDILRITYVTLVYEVIRIKKHIFGIEDALKTYTERKNIVNSITVNKLNSRKSSEIIVYKQLAKLHEELDNHKKALECHTKIFSLEIDLGSRCIDIDQCSFQEIGKLHYTIGSYEQSARYLELAYQHEEHSLTTMQKFGLLVGLAIVNMDLNQVSKVETYSQEIHTMLQDDLLTASEIYKHRSTITTVIQHLQRVNLRDIGNDLEAKLIEVILDIESHANSTICSQQNDHETLKVLEHYYEQKKYNKTIQLGKNFLKKLQTCRSNVVFLTPKIRAELLVAKAIFQSESFSKGLDKLERLLSDVLPLQSHYKKEFSEICSLLIFRLSHIETCYPQVYSVPRFIAFATVYLVFAIPLQHPSYDQGHNNFPSPPPKSTVPEIIMHSPSKEVAISGESELLNADYLEMLSVHVPSVKDCFINNLAWLWGIIFQFSSQSIVIRFIFNTLTVFVRLHTFFLSIFVFPLVIFSFFLYVFIHPFVKTFYIIIFRFPNLFFFPSTLAIINFKLNILEFLFACHHAYLHTFLLTFYGFDFHRFLSRKGLV